MIEIATLLLVEDDLDLAFITKDFLMEHHDVIHVTHKQAALAHYEANKIDLVLLDVNLPDGTGFEICQEIRQRASVPIIFMSARTGDVDRVKGLQLGGDDYIPKPYSLVEFAARVDALLRRSYHYPKADKPTKHHQIGSIIVDPLSRKVTKEGQLVELSPKEFELLLVLCEHRGQAMAKERLLNLAWGHDTIVELSSLTVHIRWLREKLEENPSEPVYLKTLWGVGYILEDSL